ncbi:hypothetical protein BJX70DRAFT_259172 [Aspergillus crustosus]
MGCCFSSSRDTSSYAETTDDHQNQTPNDATAPPHPHSRSQSLPPTPPSSNNPRHHSHDHNHRPSLLHPTSSSSRNNNNNHRHRSPVALNEHINAPIRPHTWTSKKRRWTRSLLDQERKEFFETRVTGRAEIWAALSTAISLMQNGDLVTAQSILDAAGVTIPTGDLCQGCYDERGVLYRLPRCIVSDPENLVVGDLSGDDSNRDGGSEDDESVDGGEGGAEDVDVGFETDDRKSGLGDAASGDELINDDVVRERERERRRDEKGKTSERDLIRVKARLSDRDGIDVVVSVGKSQNVGFIARKVQQEVGIPRTQRIRIAYLGKILKEHTPLVDQGWKAGHTVNALVVTRRHQTPDSKNGFLHLHLQLHPYYQEPVHPHHDLRNDVYMNHDTPTYPLFFCICIIPPSAVYVYISV